jgi:hypothetical protein
VRDRLAGGEIEWDAGMRALDAPSHRAHFFTRAAADGSFADVSASFALDSDARGPRWGLSVDVRLGASLENDAERMQEVFAACVRALAPDWAFLGTPRIPARIGLGVTAGWLTFVSISTSIARTPTAPAVLRPLDSIGQIIIAQPTPIRDDAPEHADAVRAVQRALDGAPEGAPAPPTLPVANEGEERWARWARANPGSTEGIDADALRRAVLPFLHGTPPAEFFVAVDASRAEREERASPQGPDATLVLGEPLPLPAADAPRSQEPLSLEQYAAFCAELAVYPGRAGLIHQQYGLADPNARRALDDAFAHRFRSEPAARERWQALVAHYGEWYRRQGGRG